MILNIKTRRVKRFFVLLLILLACESTFFAHSVNADLVLLNANIRTIDEKKPRAEALAVTGNRISLVGTNEEIRSRIGTETKIMDAAGKLVLPGFNDAHIHFLSVGNQFFSINLRETKTPAEAVEKIRYYTQFLPKGQWILGGAWNHENWTPAALPTKELIDAATPEHPVFIYHADPQIVLVNSLALEIARIDKTTKNPPNGEIVRDEQGAPTGILKGAAISLVRRFRPEAATENRRAVLETATNYAASFGLTSVQDVHSDDSLEIYRELAREGKLKTRVYDCVNLWDAPRLASLGVRRASGAEMIRQGCVKHFSDGDNKLIPQLTAEIAAADNAGLQVMMHAIGPRSNNAVLTVYERVIKQNGRRDRRFRIEHGARASFKDFRRFAATQTIASMQPYLFYDASGADAGLFGHLLQIKVPLAFGSDALITEINPLLGIFAAVYPQNPTNRNISVAEAVRAYTLDSAFAEFQENEKGSLSVGKLADFVILSDDIFMIDPSEIRNTKILTTVMDGRTVYQAQ